MIVITLGPEGVHSENPLIRYLSLLLGRDYSLERKKQKLQDEYRISMNYDLEEEMKTVCNLGEGIARKSRAEGANQAMLLMSKLFSLGRLKDAEKAANDPAYMKKLLAEFGLADGGAQIAQ